MMIMCTKHLARFASDHLGQFLKRRRRKRISDCTFTRVTLTCCTVRLNQMPEKAHVHTFMEFGSFFLCEHLCTRPHHL